MLAVLIGIALVIVQILSYVGNLATGGVRFFATFSIYEIAYFFSYNLVGIIGLILLFLGVRTLKKKK